MTVAATSTPAPGSGSRLRILHQRFIQVLLLQRQQNDAVRDSLEREDLDEVDDTLLDRLRAELTPPKKFSLKNKKHAPSLAYLEQLGVRELVHLTAEAQQALQLLRTPAARQLIEVGLLVGVPVGALIEHLRRMNMVVSPAAVLFFARWFWSVTAFDRATLTSMIEVRSMRRALRGVVDEDERRAALRAARTDARLLAMTLPRSPASWQLALAALGHSPAAVRVDRVLEMVGSHAALRAVEAAMRGARGDDARAASFVRVVREALELQQMVVPPDAALRAKLSNLQLVTDKTPLPNIHALSGGAHTVDVQPAAVDEDTAATDLGGSPPPR